MRRQTSERWTEPEQRPGPGDHETGQSTLINGEGATGLRFGATRFADADHTGASKTTKRGAGRALEAHLTSLAETTSSSWASCENLSSGMATR